MTHMNKALLIWDAFWRRRSLWITIFFTVTLGFLDDNSVVRLLTLKHENAILEEKIEKYEQDYEMAAKELQQLDVSQEAIERMARVKLQMKTDEEDIYIIE